AVGAHDADLELAADLLGEGDQVAARRPNRRGVVAVAEGDALGVAAAGRHDVDLRAPAAVGGEDDALTVGRVGGRGVDGVGVCQPRRVAAPEVQREDVGVTV